MAISDSILIIFLFTIDISTIMDGIFVKKDEKNVTFLTKLGWLFFGLIFTFLNLILNIFPFVYRLTKKKKKRDLEWISFIKIKKYHKVLSFWECVLYYLLEIIVGFIVGYFLTPNILLFIDKLTYIQIPLIIITACCFVILFFKPLPYSKKAKPFIITSWIIIAVCAIITMIFLYNYISTFLGINNSENVSLLNTSQSNQP